MGLDSKNFKRGINEVQGLMNGFKSSLLSFGAAIGAGFSFGALFSGLKEAALELDTAMNTLKNVSKETYIFQTSIGEVSTSVSIFGENLEYVRQLADKYGQDLAAITHGFAKFTAACNNTGLALDQQRYIYEQLTRAAAYYHLSAYESQNVMNAVVQMMSKGKIAAEELRRQLGNSLPGAFNLMAKAMGVSTAKLDNLMKEGNVISAEVLPKFAQELEKVTKGGSFDSLQLSLNKLKNAWYDFTTNSDFATYFKKGVDVATQALDFLSKNFKHLMTMLLSIGTLKLFQGIGAKGAAEIQLMVSKAQELDLMLKKAEASMIKLSTKKGGFEMQTMGGYNVAIPNKISKAYGYSDIAHFKELAAYNQKLLELHNLKLKVYGQPIFSPTEVAQIQSATNAMRAMQGTLATSTPILNKFALGFKTLGKAIGTSLKQIAKATIYTAIIQLVYEGIMAIVDSIKSANEEVKKAQEELNAIYNDYRANFEGEVDAAEKRVAQARYYLEVLKDINKSEGVRQLALEKLAELVGDIDIEKIDVNNINESAEAYKKLTERVNAWADASVKAAAISVLAQEAGAALVNQRKAQQRINEIDLSGGALTETKLMMTGVTPGTDVPIWGDVVVDTALGKERKKLVGEVAQYKRILDNADVEMKALGEDLKKILNSGTDSGNGGGGDTPLEGIDKVYDDYLKAVQALKNKLKEGAIFPSDYEEQLKKLIEKTFGDAAATGQLSISNIMDKIDKGETLNAMETWYKDIATQATGSMINAMFEEAEKLLEKLNKELNEDIEDMMENNPAIEKMQERVKQYHEYLDMIPSTFKGTRNNRFDYKKSKSDILSEEYELATERVDAIQEVIDKLQQLREDGQNVTNELAMWNEQLVAAQNNADSFAQAMDIAKIREDIEKLGWSIHDNIYGNLKNVVGNIDSIVSAFDRLNSTLDDMDASGWERFMAVFNIFTSILDTGLGLFEAFNTLQQLSTTLSAAQASEQAVVNGLKAQEIALASQMLGIKAAEIAAGETNTIVKTGEAAASTAAAAASAGEAVAGATASGAKMPFPLNLLAIAAGVAAVVTALAAMSKFEKGGIVGGNSTHGDRNIARVNSGEMILNKTQQSTLWGMLNGRAGMRGNVNFKIKGSDLIGTIENEKLKRKG
jgi:tape measure domain-containing protein